MDLVTFMNMLTRSSERIFNPMCYTGDNKTLHDIITYVYLKTLAKHPPSAGFLSPSGEAAPSSPIWETAGFGGGKKKKAGFGGGSCRPEWGAPIYFFFLLPPPKAPLPRRAREIPPKAGVSRVFINLRSPRLVIVTLESIFVHPNLFLKIAKNFRIVCLKSRKKCVKINWFSSSNLF